MLRYVPAALALLCASAQPAAADRWVFVNTPGDYKFGYEPSGTQNFSPIWFACQDGSAVVTAAAGNSYPRSGQATATLSNATGSVAISGPVPDEEYDGVYSLVTTIERSHPVFALLASGQPTAYQSAGWDPERLVSTGQTSSLDRFWAACR